MKGCAQLLYPRDWMRGRPVVKGDYISIENPIEYHPLECTDLAFDFSALDSVKDVSAFVERYGLLYKTEGYEKITGFLEEAATIRLLFRLVIAIRKRDTQFLWDVWQISEFASLFEAPPQTDDELLGQAAVLVSILINDKIQNVRHGLVTENLIEVDGQAGSPDFFLWVAFPDNLLQFIYYHLAQVIATKVPLAICPECGRLFRVEHGHQEYCSPRCSGRARIKRHRQKQQSA